MTIVSSLLLPVQLPSEHLDAIKLPTAVPELFVTVSRSCDCINKPASHVMIVDLNEDSASVEIVSKSTESGFTSEESVVSACDNSIEPISSSSDLNEKCLSGYSWNSTGSSMLCKPQCSEAGTEDNGYDLTQVHCVAEGSLEIDDHMKPSMCTFVSQDNLQSDLRQDNGYCSFDSSLDVQKSCTEVTSIDDEAMAEYAQKGLLIEDACLIVQAEMTRMTQSTSSFQTPKK